MGVGLVIVGLAGLFNVGFVTEGLVVVGLVAVGDVAEGLVDVPVEPVDPVELVELLELCAKATPAVSDAAIRMAAVLMKAISRFTRDDFMSNDTDARRVPGNQEFLRKNDWLDLAVA